MTKLDPQQLICRQLRAGHLHLAERTWLTIKDACEQENDDTDEGLDALCGGRPGLRKSMWLAAAGGENPRVSLDWLLAHSDRFAPTPQNTLRRLTFVLNASTKVRNLEVADWLVTHGGLPNETIQKSLPHFFHQAIQRADASALQWMFRQPWDVQTWARNTHEPLLLRTMYRTRGGFTDAFFAQTKFLLSQSVKPLANPKMPQGFSGGTNPLGVLAAYIRRRVDRASQDQGMVLDAPTEQRIIALWCALVQAGDDPNRIEGVKGMPSQTPRQCITGTFLDEVDRALLRAEREAPVAAALLKRHQRRVRS